MGVVTRAWLVKLILIIYQTKYKQVGRPSKLTIGGGWS